jgi:hypothetical protein
MSVAPCNAAMHAAALRHERRGAAADHWCRMCRSVASIPNRSVANHSDRRSPSSPARTEDRVGLDGVAPGDRPKPQRSDGERFALKGTTMKFLTNVQTADSGPTEPWESFDHQMYAHVSCHARRAVD